LKLKKKYIWSKGLVPPPNRQGTPAAAPPKE
jgi:hypothetical protein